MQVFFAFFLGGILAEDLLGEAGDIRLSEVGALLRDYRRLGAIVAALNARQPAHT